MKKPNERSIIAFPDYQDFFDRVYDRLYTVVERYVFIDKPVKFTLLLTALPRNRSGQIDRYEYLIGYQGVNKQIALLEGLYGKPYIGETDEESIKKTLEIKNGWNGLKQYTFSNSEGLVTNKLYNKFKNSSSKRVSSYFKTGTLSEYFNSKRKFKEYQNYEFPIINHYFDIKKDLYVSIPLIQFGFIDGVVHIIYEKAGASKLNMKSRINDNIKDLIAGFSIEYEGVILAWHLSSEDAVLNSQLKGAIDDVGLSEISPGIPNPRYVEFWKSAPPILKILQFDRYYQAHYTYFITRLKQHDEVRSDVYRRILRQAVITILLDSYAHNISAHALTTLSWIFSRRAERYARNNLTLKLIEEVMSQSRQISIEEAAIRESASINNDTWKRRYTSVPEYAGDYKILVNRNQPVSLDLFPIFKFLQEKGGFWSGLTRDLNPGGIVADLYSVLWEDFACNALYLGTIAESEDVHILNIDITFYEPELRGKKQVMVASTKKMIPTMRLATINLQEWIEHEFDPKTQYCYLSTEDKTQLSYKDHPELEMLSRFIRPGNRYADIKRRLKELRILLPGGVVGKHAFFTIIENELRNIKHFSGTVLEYAKTKGLTLNISIQQASLDDNNGQELYRMGVWLGLETDLKQIRQDTKYLVQRRFDSLWGDIIETTDYKPRLGGSSQDKVCAALLFNHNFSSVQNGSRVWHGLFLASEDEKLQGREKAFYPWITPAVMSAADDSYEFQIQPLGKYADEIRDVDDLKKEITDTYKEKFESKYGSRGYLKKYFYLWKGEDVCETNENDSGWDNVGRFRVVYARPDEVAALREKGVVRLIAGRRIDQRSLTDAYKDWLREWLEETQIALCLQDKNGDPYGIAVLDKNTRELIRFDVLYPPDKDMESSIAGLATVKEIEDKKNSIKNCIVIPYAHAGDQSTTADALLYRRHGIMNRYFISSPAARDLKFSNISSDRFMEWFEMMVTRICIIDNRIQHRMRTGQHDFDFFRKRLGLLFCAEHLPGDEEAGEVEFWNKSTFDFVKRSHFLVIHLSFIEKILRNRYARKEEDESNVGLFIQEELLGNVFKSESLPDNFILIITTGRGRIKWWDLLDQEEYKHFKKQVIFRPIESLISAIEGNATQNDHFELKYRLTKVAFGS